MSIGRSQPGAKTFLSLLVLICIFVLASLFFERVENLEKKIERAAVSKQVGEINSLLVVIMLEHHIGNQLDDLADYHGANIFDLFADRITGLNYVPSLDPHQELKQGAWYYDERSGETVYRSAFDGELYRFRLEFEYTDTNQSGRFEKAVDEPGLLSLKALALPPVDD